MVNACTIIACNYLPFASVLADSFFQQHPDGRFTVLVIDDEARQFTPEDRRIDWRRLADIGLDRPEVHRLAGIYDVTELATAIKPILLKALLDEGRDPVIYLDPDIRLYGALDDVVRLAADHSIVVTPHSMQPYPRDGKNVAAALILAVGVYNLGFVAVSSRGRPFLDWWWQATRREALNDLKKMMFTDQRWADFVPSFYDHYILKESSYNVAYWNLHARSLTAHDDGYRVDGTPLRFFHFSGYDVAQPHLLSKHQGDRPRILLSEHPALARLCGEYQTELRAAGFGAPNKRPYGWNTLPSGVFFANRMRRVYRDGVVGAEAGLVPEPPDPFDQSRAQAFLDWLNAPAEGGPRRVSRFLYSIYLDRVDLQITYPDIHGVDAAGFAEWVWQHGASVKGEEIPLELRPPPPGTAASPEVQPAVLAEGVQIAGYFRAELGIGEAARLLTSAIDAAGIPYATTTYDATLNRQTHDFVDRAAPGSFDVNIVCVNADSTPQFAGDIGPEFFAGRHTAGYWFWEIEQFPNAMCPAFDVVDEVWAATDFVATAIRAANQKPVFTMPLPVPVPRQTPGLTRAALGVPDRYTFLLLFDFLSIVERKNPLGLMEAFTRAFKPGEGPVLLLKTINGHLRLRELERLRAAAARRSDIVIIDGYFSSAQKDTLLALSDCYVSLHRSEGLGLTMAEAMTVGKPVIATAYSGNLHFMRPDTGYLVDYTLTGVPPGCEPYPAGVPWADPNLDQAAGFMREVYERPDEAAERARRGQRDVLERHSVEASAAALRARLDEIRRQRRSRVIMPGMDAPRQVRQPAAAKLASTANRASAVEPLENLLPHLEQLAAPRLGADERSFGGLRRFTQRLLFRVLRPYAFQQRQLHTQLIAALGHAADAIRREEQAREALDAQVRDLTEQLLASKRELQRLKFPTSPTGE